MIKEIQNIDWSAKFRFLSLSDSWEVFEALLVQLIEKFVPESKASQGGRRRNRVVNKRSLDAIKEKRKKKGKNTNTVRMLTIGIDTKPPEIR